MSEKFALTTDNVKAAIAEARSGSVSLKDYRDVGQPYLVLRVRGHTASYLVKTRNRTVKIGTPLPADAQVAGRQRQRAAAASETLTLREARDLSKREWAKLSSSKVAAPPPSWNWSELAEKYKTHVSDVRQEADGTILYPSADTLSDVKQAFGRKAVASWGSRPLTSLDEDDFEDAVKAIHAANGWDACRKFRAYVNAALTWAAKHHRRTSGLSGRHWWKLVAQPPRTPDEVRQKMERDKRLREIKASFKVEHLGVLLVEHEKFCAGREGNERISPGVRWGLWWDALTGHRRGSGTWVAVEDINFADPLGEAGWGLATWQPDIMKTQDKFVLPIPPLGLHIVRCMMRDYKKALIRAKLPEYRSKWVFASRVIQSNAGDIAVSGSALANHLRNLRGLRGANHRNLLADIPHFSMHIIRSTMGDYLIEETKLPAGTASLMINHAILGDKKGELQNLSPTTKRFYVQAHRIPQKTLAMAAWSDALLKAYKAAGGIYPD
jgi:hypothetical protein